MVFEENAQDWIPNYLIFVILRTGNGPDAMINRQCGPQKKQRCENYLDAGKFESPSPERHDTSRAATPCFFLFIFMTILWRLTRDRFSKGICKINNFQDALGTKFYGLLFEIAYLSLVLCFSKYIITALTEIHNLQQVYFKIKLCLVCKP